jgi:ketosteroid isomerase-like protein
MSKEPTTPDLAELVRGFWASAARRDWPEILRFYAPDAVWDMSPMGLGTYENQAAMRGLWQDWVAAYDELDLDVEALVYSWEEGMVVHVTIYPDIDDARAAAERLADSRD